MDRFVCPPWFEYPCIFGKPISRTTTRSHRKHANQKRSAIGLGPFAWVPKVPRLWQGLFLFDCHDSLESHPSDKDTGNCLTLIRRCVYINSNHNILSSSSHAHTVHNSTYPTAPNRCGRGHDSSHSRSSALLYQQTDNSPAPGYQETSTVQTETSQLSSSQIDAAQSTLPQVITSFEDSAGAASELRETDSNRSPSLSSHDSDQHSPSINGKPQSNPIESNVEETPLQRADIAVTQRIPELLPWMAANRRWIELFYKHALKDTFLDEALDILGAPCKQWKTIVSNISHLSGLKEEMQNFAMCLGHMAFIPDPIQDEIPAHCSQCRKAVPQIRNADNVYTYLPILPRLQSMIREEKTCQEIFAYRKTRLSDPNVCRDFFDGAVYRKICSRFGRETAVENDVFIIAYTDGFSPFKNRSYDVWSIAAINLNLPPHQIYMPQNVFPMAFVPGPNQRKDIQSFLLPLVREYRMSSYESC